jgi:hypothetical protein
MIDVEPIEVSPVIDAEDLYHDPEDEFAPQGIMREEKYHVTTVLIFVRRGGVHIT